MTLCSDLFLNRKVTVVLVFTALILVLCLSSPFFNNLYIITAHSSSSSSSLKHKNITEGEGTIQICCSWGNQIADGILTYRITDGSNSQVIKAVHQAIDEWNSKVSNIKLQESIDNNTSADIDIKISSKAPQVTHAAGTIGGHAIVAGKNTKLVQPGEAVISTNTDHLITHVSITISTT